MLPAKRINRLTGPLLEAAAIEVACGVTLPEVAAKLNLNIATLRLKFEKDGDTIQKVALYKREIISRNMAAAVRSSARAIKRLEEHMEDPDPKVSLSACKTLVGILVEVHKDQREEIANDPGSILPRTITSGEQLSNDELKKKWQEAKEAEFHPAP